MLDGLASLTSEPHLYTAASLVRDPVLFAALAYYVSLLIYYNCFLITVSNTILCHGPFLYKYITVERHIKITFSQAVSIKGERQSMNIFYNHCL